MSLLHFHRNRNAEAMRTAARSLTLSALNIAGRSVRRDAKGFHRAFRNIRGKVHRVYPGRTFPAVLIFPRN
ncbi:MAG: hypothetical protein R2941_07370 [Desulfobacterales bacterium]